MGSQVSFPAGIEDGPFQFIFRGKSYRVNQAVDLAELFLHLVKSRVNALIAGHITFNHFFFRQAQLEQALFQAVILVTVDHFPALGLDLLSAAPGNGPLVGHAHYQKLFSS